MIGFNLKGGPPAWLHADLSADQASAGLNSDIIWNETHAQNGGLISLNTSTGVLTLAAGRTFVLEAQVYTAYFSDASGFAFYEWVYASDNTEVPGAVRATTRPVSATGQHAIQPIAKSVIKTVVETQVKTRCVSALGTHTLEDIGTCLFVTEIV